MKDQFRFLLRRARELLWVKPLVACFLSVFGALLAWAADDNGFDNVLPEVTIESVKTLLSVMAASMLVIATFSVSSMISAYSAASSSATPRAFALVVADDVSQNALSSFIGAFIFSIVALIALLNDFYGIAGRFVLFALTLLVFLIIIATFVRWVDRIARLGRMEATIEKAEAATVDAMIRRRDLRRMGGQPLSPRGRDAAPVYTTQIGYVQQLDISKMQAIAEQRECLIEIVATPGTFTTPLCAIAYIKSGSDMASDISDEVEAFFRIGKKRTFEDDPGFGLTVLAEIASRALSPGINDPGTAINVIGAFVRAFCIWLDPRAKENLEACFDRVEVPELSLADMYDDAFAALTRDGAGTVEVIIRLLEAYKSLLPLCDEAATLVTQEHAEIAIMRAEGAISFPREREQVRAIADRFREACRD